MVKPALFDTVILIDYLNGIPAARRVLERRKDPAISLITWMEVMAGVRPELESETGLFLGRFRLIPISQEIAERAVVLRRVSRLKLPDAIILATAQIEGRILVTRNTRDFTEDGMQVIVPYQV